MILLDGDLQGSRPVAAVQGLRSMRVMSARRLRAPFPHGEINFAVDQQAAGVEVTIASSVDYGRAAPADAVKEQQATTIFETTFQHHSEEFYQLFQAFMSAPHFSRSSQAPTKPLAAET